MLLIVVVSGGVGVLLSSIMAPSEPDAYELPVEVREILQDVGKEGKDSRYTQAALWDIDRDGVLDLVFHVRGTKQNGLMAKSGADGSTLWVTALDEQPDKFCDSGAFLEIATKEGKHLRVRLSDGEVKGLPGGTSNCQPTGGRQP